MEKSAEMVTSEKKELPKKNLHQKDKSSKTERFRIYRKYRSKSNQEGFKAIGFTWLKISIIAFCIVSVSNFLPPETETLLFTIAYFPLAVLLATVYRGFENLVHEASHFNLFKKRNWNNSLQILFAFPVFKDVVAYRESHDLHHAHVGDLENDPDMQMYIEWGLHKLTKKNFVWLMLIKPLFYMPYYFIKNSFWSFWSNPNSRIQKIAFWSVVLAIVTITGFWTEFVLFYVIPFGLILPTIRYWCESSEHIGFDLNHHIPNSRNNLGFIHRFMHPFNDGYHQIHHDACYISWYHLPKVHKELNKENTEYREDTQTSKGLVNTFQLMLRRVTKFKK